ncbi:hypothetical protein N781_13225 [Pontibacillus halophilus JSM 076056 = DSM 19796]|uniref:Uncharacterized protein n=1 Tax=Pontibacillus halophilus JSM 076056 = DSM 19796 TaxID=1385510 RepID=A0A0A5IAI9_9BACI|nr:hypothetical protein [Pontibacillus halophilus]KGX92852.1 hypothetical protein N781_13225 [Pontibacillus halophilus JSM 076056 = DSM 19796]
MTAEERETLVKQVVEEIYQAFPWFYERFGKRGYEKTVEDNLHHVDHLLTAYEMEDEEFFVKYVLWLERVLVNRGISSAILLDNLERLYRNVHLIADTKVREAFRTYLQQGMEQLNASN